MGEVWGVGCDEVVSDDLSLKFPAGERGEEPCRCHSGSAERETFTEEGATCISAQY